MIAAIYARKHPPAERRQGASMTNEHLAAIGRITVEYSHVEWIVSAFIWKLVAMDQRIGQTITSSLNFSGRIALLRALFGMLPPYGIAADLDGLETVLKQAESAATKRNAVVHALLWHSTESGDFAHANLKPKKAAEWTQVPASVQDLIGVAEQLKAAYERLSHFMMKHFEPYGSSAWASPMGPGTLWGPTVQVGIAWQLQFGGDK
jgi:hypothetical protein